MTFQQQTTQSEKRQFQLVKYFAYASFIVLIIFSFLLSGLISKQAKDILMKSYENYARLIGENLNHQVFQNFVVPVALRYGSISLRDKNQYERMDRIIKNTIHGFNIDLVNAYDIGQGVITYSTDPRLLGKKVRESKGYKEAFEGGYFSGLIPSGDDYWGLSAESTGGKKKLRTYIPFRGTNPISGGKGYVLGVFEIIQDLTEEYQDILKFQILVFILSILIMGLIFVALLLIAHKAEKLIEARAKEQMELESQLNQAERLAALGQMIAGVSHEIRNPLGIIRSTAELLAGMANSDEAQKKLSEVIIEESSRLNNIVTEFMDFARPMKPNMEDCNLEEIVRKGLVFLNPQLDKEEIRVHDNLDSRPFKLKGDPQLLYRAFLNIFINSIQSMKNGGDITVDVTEKKGFYAIGIKDTGCGISKENLSKIFNPFFSSKDEGSGLGLSIVRNIVEAHQGSIQIESSEGEQSGKSGTGTNVLIKLPQG